MSKDKFLNCLTFLSCILGKPGSGKGTQASLIAKKYKLHHFSTGGYFRNELKKKTKLGEEIKVVMDSPNLVLDDVANKVATDVIKKFNGENILFDGYPRTVAQAEFLNDKVKIDLVILLNVSDKIAIERLELRQKTDPRTETDTKQKIKGRLKVFQKLTEPLIEFYKKKKKLCIINGELDIKLVQKEIRKKIG